MGVVDGKPGVTPMEMLLLGVAGCTGMDVASILTKMRQKLTGLKISVRGKRFDEHPKIFTEIEVLYELWARPDPKAVENAIGSRKSSIVRPVPCCEPPPNYVRLTEFIRLRNIFLEEIMIAEPVHVSDANFQKTVLESPIPTIVDFWAPWCGPCRMVAPTLDKLAKEYSGKLLVAKVNTDENPEWAQRYGVQGIPTMLFVAKGKVIHRQVGALPEPMLREVVVQFLETITEN